MTRIFSVSGTFMMTRTVTLSNLIFENGLVSGTMNENGGAIGATGFPFADLVIQDCTFRNNRVQCEGTSCQARGGAISAAGQLTIVRSTFEGNTTHCSVNNQQCFTRAGAVEHDSNSSLTISNSTFANNQTSCEGTGDSSCTLEGGALHISSSGSVMNNNTFADNTILCDASTCSLFGSTIYIDGTGPDTTNTIITNALGVVPPNCDGTLTDSGNNLQFPVNSCGGTIPTEDADPEPLADNGGITETMAITEESPAFNEGNNGTCEDTDQRGVSRPQEGTCDIGAYELIPDDEPPAPPAPSEPVVIVPTMGQWGMIILAVFSILISITALRNRNENT
ncbi:MAG TPA: choice-of-anchor Q domain-containing protein [Thermodesulfobacteriota bacterium]|nr:choice-of-anchor Q domain-containing protein [Thermodesulfobacteriota bacterium]